MQKRHRKNSVFRPTGSASGLRPAPVIIRVMNPAAFSGKGSIIMLEVADENAALRAARLIARETGRCVSVHHSDMALIETIPPLIFIEGRNP
jgi:hypothetical protein